MCCYGTLVLVAAAQVALRMTLNQIQTFLSVRAPLKALLWRQSAPLCGVRRGVAGKAHSTCAAEAAVSQCLLSQTARDKCFQVCVTRPSSSLGSSEQQCLSRCLDRYTEVRG